MTLFAFGNRYLKHKRHKLYVYGNFTKCSANALFGKTYFILAYDNKNEW